MLKSIIPIYTTALSHAILQDFMSENASFFSGALRNVYIELYVCAELDPEKIV